MNPASEPTDNIRLDPQRVQRVAQWLDRQISSQRLAGASVLIGGQRGPEFFHAAGVAGVSDLAEPGNAGAGEHAHPTAQLRSFQRDTIVRLYSMTKPVTTSAALMLYEQGCFQLDDPVAWYLPAFAAMRVWRGTDEVLNDEDRLRQTEPARSPMTIRQLMNHTSGLTYSFMNATPVDQYYRDKGLVFPGASESLAVLVDRLAYAPLLCHPGSQWNYSVATDVLGRLVEVWSGLSLAEFFKQHLFNPLGMNDTGFHVAADSTHRFADLYGPAAGGDLGSIAGGHGSSLDLSVPPRSVVTESPIPLDVLATTLFLQDPPLYSGGGGLVGSIDDFARFSQCLLNEGELDGERLLARKTVQLMRQNHLPHNQDMASMGQALWSETSYNGIGFGLGGAVVLDPVSAGLMSSTGEYHWGGAASTFFWLDPVEKLYVVLLTQLYPSSSYPLRTELRPAVYQALV